MKDDDILFLIFLWVQPGLFILFYLQIELEISSMIPCYLWVGIGIILGIAFLFSNDNSKSSRVGV